MKEIFIPRQSLWNKQTEKFIEIEAQTIKLEHSLRSIRLWESKWKKSYIFTKEKTVEEAFDYIKHMTLNRVNPNVYYALTEEDVLSIKKYIEDPMTATTIDNIQKKQSSNEIVTAELIYYWMIAQNIPWQFENWHINQLMTLIEVCALKNDPNPKKMSRNEIFARNKALNAQRKAALKSRG